ncbi:TPA: hypothetical protein P7486_001895 [Klebsiella pneumoniae]|nr:hypothetical protein [Klebsiella pneumoniae]HCM7848443.1 hypothetical protein [Klebsiella pneumoniae]HDQ3516585.1 hypothetical protein [Klebsiella pneumoniae]
MQKRQKGQFINRKSALTLALRQTTKAAKGNEKRYGAGGKKEKGKKRR